MRHFSVTTTTYSVPPSSPSLSSASASVSASSSTSRSTLNNTGATTTSSRRTSYPTPSCKAFSSWQLDWDPTLQQHYYTNLQDGTISFDSPCEVSHRKRKNSLFNGIKRRVSPCGNSSSSSSSSSSKSLLQKIKSYGKKNRSSESVPAAAKDLQKTNTSGTTNSGASRSLFDDRAYWREEQGGLQGLDEDFLLMNDQSNQFRNFAGTSSLEYDDYESITTEEEELASYVSTEGDADAEEEEEDEMDQVRPFNSKYIYGDAVEKPAPSRDDTSFRYWTGAEQDEEEDYDDDDESNVDFADFDKEIERRELRLQMLKELY
ncbi:uncharacterized protein LODBEIA_P60400 [Lodderomyces beijingensis]|uniref:WW domain-containing protein n=1 Tax=Lodderomyces beijingensis TaxID=1775926 RepID=A0ABP0ZUK7_9ASCO